MAGSIGGFNAHAANIVAVSCCFVASMVKDPYSY